MEHDLGCEVPDAPGPVIRGDVAARVDDVAQGRAAPRARARVGSSGSEMPMTSAPSARSQHVSQEPLNPVWPVSRTRRPLQNAGSGSGCGLGSVKRESTALRRCPTAGSARRDRAGCPSAARSRRARKAASWPREARVASGSASSTQSSPVRRESIAGSNTKKPPLIRSCEPIGFSRNRETMPSCISSAPNRGGWCTAVTVASAPRAAVIVEQVVDRDVGQPVAVGEQEGLGQHGESRCRRPPVIVVCPVSTSVTRQSSGCRESTSTEPVPRSIERSASCVR